MHLIVFAYRVDPERITEFEATYGPAGPWVELFRRTPGYVETSLLTSAETPGEYLLIDRWCDRASHARFLEEHGTDYEALAARCGSLYADERRIGAFTSA